MDYYKTNMKIRENLKTILKQNKKLELKDLYVILGEMFGISKKMVNTLVDEYVDFGIFNRKKDVIIWVQKSKKIK